MSILDDKTFKICNVLGGLDVTRVVSSNARHFFQGAIEDVELIREYVSQAAINKGIVGGFSDLNAMNHSLQWKVRGLSRLGRANGPYPRDKNAQRCAKCLWPVFRRPSPQP